MRFVLASFCAVLLSSSDASAGPETALREFAGGQVKKGVRTIGMGGDGATTGNYALVYKDAGGAIFDYGVVHFLDTQNVFVFDAVGFTTPTFWDDAAFYVIALGQHATDVRVWTDTGLDTKKPPAQRPLRLPPRGNATRESQFKRRKSVEHRRLARQRTQSHKTNMEAHDRLEFLARPLTRALLEDLG